MRFERIPSGDFVVEGITIPKQVFLSLEPSYSEPMDTVHFRYDSGVGRTITTKTKQYKILGMWEDGERYFRRLSDLRSAASVSEEETNQEIAEIDTTVAKPAYYRQSRKNEYPPLSDLIVALWENVIEKKTKKESGVDNIQKLRKEIKSKYSLENNINAISQDETETN